MIKVLIDIALKSLYNRLDGGMLGSQGLYSSYIFSHVLLFSLCRLTRKDKKEMKLGVSLRSIKIAFLPVGREMVERIRQVERN